MYIYIPTSQQFESYVQYIIKNTSYNKVQNTFVLISNTLRFYF